MAQTLRGIHEKSGLRSVCVRTMCFPTSGKRYSSDHKVAHVDDVSTVGDEERRDDFGNRLNTMVPVKNLRELRYRSGLYREKD